MKYTIVIDQAGIAAVPYLLENTDLTDWAIIDYLRSMQGMINADTITDEDGTQFVRISHDRFAEDMPLLLLCEQVLEWRIMDLRRLGLVDVIKKNGNIYVHVTPFASTAFTQE